MPALRRSKRSASPAASGAARPRAAEAAVGGGLLQNGGGNGAQTRRAIDELEVDLNEQDNLGGGPLKKSVALAYLLFFVGGWCGAHHWYLQRDTQAGVWAGSCGFGLAGLLRDLLCLPRYVRECNEDLEQREHLRAAVRHHAEAPPQGYFSARFVGSVLGAWWLGWLFTSLPTSEGAKLQAAAAAAGAALGAHLVQSAPHRVSAPFAAALKYAAGAAAVVSLLEGWKGRSSIFWLALCAAEGSRRACVWDTRVAKRRRRGACRRGAWLLLLLALYWCVVLWGAYQHGTITTTDDDSGEKTTTKLRESVDEILNSPAVRQLKAFLARAVATCWADGFGAAFNFVADELDPTGERTALETLGVGRSADMAEVKKAYKRMAREYHPDKRKVKGSTTEGWSEAQCTDKMAAINEAYDKLRTVREGKRNRGGGGGRGGGRGSGRGGGGRGGGGRQPRRGADNQQAEADREAEEEAAKTRARRSKKKTKNESKSKADAAGEQKQKKRHRAAAAEEKGEKNEEKREKKQARRRQQQEKQQMEKAEAAQEASEKAEARVAVAAAASEKAQKDAAMQAAGEAVTKAQNLASGASAEKAGKQARVDALLAEAALLEVELAEGGDDSDDGASVGAVDEEPPAVQQVEVAVGAGASADEEEAAAREAELDAFAARAEALLADDEGMGEEQPTPKSAPKAEAMPPPQQQQGGAEEPSKTKTSSKHKAKQQQKKKKKKKNQKKKKKKKNQKNQKKKQGSHSDFKIG